MLRLADDERRADADHALRLPQDDLDPPRGVVFRAGDLDRAWRGLDAVQPDDAPLDLRDRLLRDDDDVPVLELDALEDERHEVVALLQLGNSQDREDGDAGHRPTMRTPA